MKTSLLELQREFPMAMPRTYVFVLSSGCARAGHRPALLEQRYAPPVGRWHHRVRLRDCNGCVNDHREGQRLGWHTASQGPAGSHSVRHLPHPVVTGK